ncbi:50S ribosomal protein L11 [Candidatus Woesearchaeota archaeon]|nr:50S ribosomal protein L11 [Candidatus Woesearchaeota archaeon]
MGKEKVNALIEGGKASAAPPLGPSLGPLGINIGEVIKKINEKTAAFKGMKVPVKITVDTSTKEFEIEIGTPPVSQLIKKELNLEKGSGTPHSNKLGNLAIEQAIKVALMKKDSMYVKDLKAAVKNVVGSAHSLGILIEGKKAIDINSEIDKGVYDKEIKAAKTEVDLEKQKRLAKELSEVQETYKKELERIAKEQAEKEAAAAAAKPAAAAGEETKAGEESKKEEKKPATAEKSPEKKEEKKPATAEKPKK